MHIHLDENPVRYVACKSSPSMPYVSLETVAKCSNLDMTATRKWVRVNKVRVHVCRRVVYVAAHAILQFLTEHNKTSDKPPMDVHAGLDILTAKIAPHVPRQPYLPMPVASFGNVTETLAPGSAPTSANSGIAGSSAMGSPAAA